MRWPARTSTVHSERPRKATYNRGVSRTYRLPPSLIFRFPSETQVEAMFPDKKLTIPASVHRLLVQFAQPATSQHVYGRMSTDASLAQFQERLEAFVKMGLLVAGAPERRGSRPRPKSMRDVLSPRIMRRPVLRKLSEYLRRDEVCIIHDAFAPRFAERVHASLLQSKHWKLYEEIKPFFAYHHHNLYLEAQYPEVLQECMQILSAEATKQLVEELAGIDCSGEVQFGASQYLPGDYSLPHNDTNANRSVAYIWHLTKGPWRPEWGGQFFWCRSATSILPSFNTLTLFRVNQHSTHFVCAVSPLAAGRRLAVNGWWTRRLPEGVRPEPPAPEPSGRWFQGTVRKVSDQLYVLGPGERGRSRR
jgi:hypothetical protein